VKELPMVKAEGSILTFAKELTLDYAGHLKFGFRMFPKNDLLPHRMDFAYLRWL
jgi:starch phosphorylase